MGLLDKLRIHAQATVIEKEIKAKQRAENKPSKPKATPKPIVFDVESIIPPSRNEFEMEFINNQKGVWISDCRFYAYIYIEESDSWIVYESKIEFDKDITVEGLPKESTEDIIIHYCMGVRILGDTLGRLKGLKVRKELEDDKAKEYEAKKKKIDNQLQLDLIEAANKPKEKAVVINTAPATPAKDAIKHILNKKSENKPVATKPQNKLFNW